MKEQRLTTIVTTSQREFEERSQREFRINADEGFVIDKMVHEVTPQGSYNHLVFTLIITWVKE